MMLVRAMILGLEIDTIAPGSRLIYNHKKRYDFCAMVPLQLENIISESRNIKKIILGGTSVGKSLLDKIKDCNSKFYETYGMTETVTHVAVKQLHSKSGTGENYFKALPNVLFKKNEHNCLIIHAPKLLNQPLITNDVIDLKSDTSFKLLGRYDNVINSGGIKLFPEQIELKLQSIIKERFIIASENDDSLGEKLILLIEKPSSSIDDIMSSIQKLATLDKFEIPKKIYALDTFLETNSGKIQRKKTVEAALHR